MIVNDIAQYDFTASEVEVIHFNSMLNDGYHQFEQMNPKLLA